MTSLIDNNSDTPRSLPGLGLIDSLIQRFAPLAGRLLIVGMFTSAGLSKIGAFAGTQAYMESVGLPGGLLPLVILFEIAAGLALIIGLKTRFIATLLAGFTALTAFMFHFELSDPVQSLFFYKNLAISGGLLAFATFGSGPMSLDQYLTKKGNS